MENELTTKDLMALNELMTFENWLAIKLKACSTCVKNDSSIKTMLADMAKKHYESHSKLLDYLSKNSNEGGKK